MGSKEKQKKKKSSSNDPIQKSHESVESLLSNEKSEMIKKETSIIPQNDVDAMNQLLPILENPERILLPESKNNQSNPEETLIHITKYLFTRVEQLAHEWNVFSYEMDQNENNDKSSNEYPEEPYPLSGINELYTGESMTMDTHNGTLDMETIWGQLDIQNNALCSNMLIPHIKKIKKQIKRSNNKNDLPVLLQMDDDSVISSENLEEKNDESENSEDDVTKRMRERMERAMEDMDNDDDDDDDDNDGNDGNYSNDYNNNNEQTENNDDDDEPVETKTIGNDDNDDQESDLEDPAANTLNDGFFSIGDMENFADEEEEFHTFLSDDMSDDNNDNDNKKVTKKKTRQKYRDDEAINALHSLYENPNDDSSKDDVIDMTAADYFGKPNPKYFPNWRGHKKNTKKKVTFDDLTTTNNNDSNSHSDNHNDNEDWPIREDDENMSNDEGNNHSNNSESKKVNKEDNDDHKTNKTPLSIYQTKLNTQTKLLEKDILAEKPWQMKGETQSNARPINSLLESTPEFTMANKIAPTITIEHTNNLEEMIKARILAEDWDDVIPRELPDIFKNKKSNDLEDVSQEKSKLGLGELYEREYLKKAVGYDVDQVEKQTAEDLAKNEMRMLFANLCSKLDAMSNYHFAPRPVMEEADIRAATTPAIAIEEMIPMYVNDQRGVAPEEVYDGGKKRGKESVLKGESEMTQVDRKRLHNTKKAARRKKRKEKLADEKLISRLHPAQSGLNNPYEKRKIKEELSLARSRGHIITGEIDENKDFTTSSKFFKRMQEESEREVRDFGSKKQKLEDTDTRKKSSAYMM